MGFDARYLLRLLALAALYLAGGVLASWFIHAPDQVALIWPPAGLGFALLLSEGVVFWPFIPLGVLALHLSVAPVPTDFLPFSIAANTLSALAAVAYARRGFPRASTTLSVYAGFNLLRAALLMVSISALVGTAGLVHAGMVPRSDFGPAALRWLMGDLFGVVAVGPAVLVARRFRATPGNTPRELLHDSLREKIAWIVLMPLALAAVLVAGQRGTSYALGASALPMAGLLWAALRFEPPWALIGTMLTALFVAVVAGHGFSGFVPPTGLFDTVILLAFLCVSANIPQIVVAATYENRIAALRLVRRAATDALTGLLNRSAFEERCRAISTRDADADLALVYLDVDQFKLVNDTTSHAAGDHLIQGLAGVLRTLLREGELLARTGGDEFAMLLRGTGPEQAEQRARLVCESVASYRAAHQGQLLAVTASVSVVPFRAGAAEFGALLARADAACYTAKELGGNRVQLAVLGEQAVADRTAAMQWAVRLGEAIELDRFELYCQSMVPVMPGAGPGRRRFEILLRLNDGADGAVLLPGQFVAAAERFKLGVRLDRHVVERTLGWLERHPDAAASVERCSINLTAASIEDEEFAAFLELRLARSTIAASQLCFEVTETSAVRDLARAQRFIMRVRAMGCQFALDDFGTGFCSFAYLKSLDVDYYKIDGSFVREVHSSPLALAIVRSIAEIARVMRKQTVAEYAESDIIRQHLVALGVDYAQGFAIDEPMPIERYFATPIATARAPLPRTGT